MVGRSIQSPCSPLLESVMQNVNADVNPYSPPTSGFELVPSSEPRSVPRGAIVIVGGALGAISFWIAMALVPSDTASPTTHDLSLANNLGFVYPPLLGLWAGWIRRSTAWAIFGLISGCLIGLAYYALCGTNFLAVMVGFPCILGGATSVLLGTRHDSWISGIPQRLIKGLVAGFVLGFTYMVTLNIVIPFTSPHFPYSSSVTDHSTGMWIAGTVAPSLASALYLPVFHWSAGLNEYTRHKGGEPSDATDSPSRAS